MKSLYVLITDRQTNSMPPAITVESRERQEHTNQWRAGFTGVRGPLLKIVTENSPGRPMRLLSSELSKTT